MPSAAAPKGGSLKKKAAGLPLWVWGAAAALVLGYLFLHRGSSSSGGQASTGAAGNTAGAQGGTPATGGLSDAALGSVLAHDEAQQGNLLAGILGAQSALVDVNSNLTSGLINSQNAIIGLGQTALQENGALEQAIIAHMGMVGVGAPAAGGGGGGGSAPPSGNAPASAAPYAKIVSNATASLFKGPGGTYSGPALSPTIGKTTSGMFSGPGGTYSGGKINFFG